jgi:acyl carrier protein
VEFDRTDAQRVVYRAIDQVNEVQPEDNLLVKAPGTVLVGQGGQLDSMAFVNFVAALEEQLTAIVDTNANVIDELNARSLTSKATTVADWIEVVRSVLQSVVRGSANA